MDALERRAFALEYRAENNRLELRGVALPYAPAKGTVGRFTESFAPGSLRFNPRGVFANVMHREDRLLAKYPDGGMVLEDGKDGLRIAVGLPDTSEGRDAAEMVRQGVYGGFSVEFRCIRDAWSGTHRTVQEAILDAISVVHKPAYVGAAINAGKEVRAEAYLAGRHNAQPIVRRKRWRSP